MYKINILMATYNGEKYIKEQIKSIKDQSFTDWRLFIRDDGSTDSTVILINLERIGWEEKIVIIKSAKEIEGISGNFYELLKRSKSKYIVFADQDDVWVKEKLSRLYQTMYEKEKLNGEALPLLVHSDLTIVNSHLKILSKSFFKTQLINPYRNMTKHLLVQNIVTGCTMMINKSLKKLIIPFHSEIVMHDWWIALIASISGQIILVEEPLILYRQHGKNSIGASMSRFSNIKIEIKRIIYPRKYNPYNQIVNQAIVLKKHLIAKGSYDENLDVLDKFIAASNMKNYKRLIYMLIYGFLKYPFYRNLYILRIS